MFLTMKENVVIIGGGIAGMEAARQLLLLGYNPIVVEQKEQLRLERVCRTVLVKLRQERIFSKILFNEHCIPAITDSTGK